MTTEKVLSLPVRGAWIEIRSGGGLHDHQRRRSPCGERGLKSCAIRAASKAAASLPVRGAWIEMTSCTPSRPAHWSLPVRGAWIEIMCSSTWRG